VIVVAAAHPFLGILTICVPLLIAMRRSERAHLGRSVPNHLRPMRWAVLHPWEWSAGWAVAFGGFSLVASRSLVSGAIAALVVFVIIGIYSRYGFGRWYAKRRLRRFDEADL
jgi:hypothetical protein